MKERTILILNGPNLNLLGQREPEIYGRMTLDDLEALCQEEARKLDFGLKFFQSNHEGAILDEIHKAIDMHVGIIINPGAFTHYAYAIFDALCAYQGVVVEVHLSNIYKREVFRHKSVTAPRADGVIAGLGAEGYLAALRYMAARLKQA